MALVLRLVFPQIDVAWQIGIRMINLIDEYTSELIPGTFLAAMPVSRLVLEMVVRIDQFRLVPAGELDLASFNIDAPFNVEAHLEQSMDLGGNELRLACSSLTGACSEIFETHSSICFSFTPPDHLARRNSHADDIKLIAFLSETAERVMDWIRFEFCRFDLPHTLPGLAGTWEDSGTLGCAVIYAPLDRRATLLGGDVALHSVVSRGLGLELNEIQCPMIDGSALVKVLDGEVGAVAQYALRLFSDVMNANSNTAKYLLAMTLLEFLAFPYGFQKFQDSKKDIAVHIAATREEYDDLLQKLRRLSDLKDEATGAQSGYRTLLVHHGKFLEEIITNDREQRALFLELQGYVSKVIADLIERKAMAWQEIVEYRRQRRAMLLGLQ